MSLPVPKIDTELPVAIGATPSHPFPTTVLLDANLKPETGRQTGVAKKGRGAKLKLHRELIPPGVVGSDVHRVAAPCCNYNHYLTLTASPTPARGGHQTCP